MKKTVILVTNNLLTREALSGRLQDENYEVLLADKAWEGLEICTRREPDLLLVDLDWPADDR